MLACLLEIPPKEIPNFADGLAYDKEGVEEYWKRKKKWLDDRGWAWASFAFDSSFSLEDMLDHGSELNQKMHWVLCGKSRNGTNHVVICKGGEIVHDPAIDGSGIVGPTNENWWHIEYLVPLHPQKLWRLNI